MKVTLYGRQVEISAADYKYLQQVQQQAAAEKDRDWRDLCGAKRPTAQQASAYVLKWCDSYTRLGTVIQLASRMQREEWLILLGEAWSCCDNIADYRVHLESVLKDRAYPQMMNEAERQKLADLPEVVTVYRGADRGVNERGLCWSLDRAVASAFPFKDRYRAKQPVLVTAQIRRDRIIAVKLDREEAEVIARPSRWLVRRHRAIKLWDER